MPNIPVQLVKAFTKNPDEGNPAGVVLDAENLSDTEMQNIAQELGFSESSFVSKSDVADFRIQFFSPTEEINLCAHGTIAAIHALKKSSKFNKQNLQIETKAGFLKIVCQEDGLIIMEQTTPVLSDFRPDPNEISKLLNISPNKITDWPLKVVSTGTPKLLIPIKNLQTLLEIKPDLDGIKKYCKKSGAKGFYPFTTETQSQDSDFHARQFNPLAGIDEDPITGVAAGALASYIKEFHLSSKTKFTIEQGFSMKKPGKIFVDVSNSVKVGGYAVSFGSRLIN